MVGSSEATGQNCCEWFGNSHQARRISSLGHGTVAKALQIAQHHELGPFDSNRFKYSLEGQMNP